MLRTGGKNLNFIPGTGKISPSRKGPSVGICCSGSPGSQECRLQSGTKLPESKTSKENRKQKKQTNKKKKQKSRENNNNKTKNKTKKVQN